VALAVEEQVEEVGLQISREALVTRLLFPLLREMQVVQELLATILAVAVVVLLLLVQTELLFPQLEMVAQEVDG
jgi:hypothetical protein